MSGRRQHYRIRRAAYHEAGHAVMRLARTGIATAIDVNVDGSGLSHGSGETIRGSDAIEILLAGALAEAKACGGSVAGTFQLGGMNDFSDACRRAKDAADGGYGTEEDVLRNAEENAKHWLRDYWPSVERLANALLEHRSLTSIEVAAIAAVD